MSQNDQSVFVVTGITGQVGGTVGRTLLAAGKLVRAVVRDAAKGAPWQKLGCEIAVADMNDAKSLAAAFAGAQAVFVLLPPTFAPSEGFPEAKATIAAIKAALVQSAPKKVVALSTIGAQASRTNLLTQLQLLEKSLGELPIPVTCLRPAWFMENAAWDVEPARKQGLLRSFLQPMDKQFPMVATADVGRVAAEFMQQEWNCRQVVELEGPRRVTPNDIAAALSKSLGRPVRGEVVPRETWEAVFASQGGGNSVPRIQMLDGFNEGWIRFESEDRQVLKGKVSLDEVIGKLVAEKA